MPSKIVPRKIVAAYDGSGDSGKAVKVAADLARKHGARLTVVHVYSPPLIAFSGNAPVPASTYTDMENAAKLVAGRILSRGVKLAESREVRPQRELLRSVSVVQALVELLEDEKADLAVVGTRGVTGFKRLIIGSVSSGVVSHAPCSVLVVR
jgi:nucleotide-binding universal stress UspA family protein